MLNQTQILFFIFLLLVPGVAIAFSYFVVKPMQTYWAVKKAREITASGEIRSRWQFENVFRILATAWNDLEAAYLWRKLQELREETDKQKAGK
ncbi:hypothetical protein ACFLYE_03170 [Chloroflexota bacterium]